MKKVLLYLASAIFMILVLAWLAYGVYDCIKNLPLILMALGFFALIAIIALFIRNSKNQGH